MRPSARACGVRLLPQCPRVECPRPLSAKTAAAADEARATDWQGLVASQRPARKAGTDPTDINSKLFASGPIRLELCAGEAPRALARLQNSAAASSKHTPTAVHGTVRLISTRRRRRLL